MPTFSRFTRYFVEVARLGSIRKASETLHVSASAIDRQILKAEEALGVALFERLPGGLRPSSAGELLLANVQAWEKGLRRTLEQFDELQGLRRGHVDIAMIDALSEGLVAEAVAELNREYPRLTFGLQTANNSEVVDKVIAGEVDFGLLLDPVAGGDLQVRASAEIPLGLAMRPDHPLAGRRTAQLGDALPYGLILPAAPLIVHQHAQSLYRSQNVDQQRLSTCNDVRMLRSLIRLDVGVGLLSWLDVATDVAVGHLVFVPLRQRQAKPLLLSLCVAPHRQLSKAAQRALEVLALKVGGLGPSPAASA